jgi:uncharacterized membrane protein
VSPVIVFVVGAVIAVLVLTYAVLLALAQREDDERPGP